MKVVRLRLNNYRRHRSTEVEWPDGVTAVLGRNGSGKSTLLEAIGFALFGVAATRTGKDLLRWDGAAPTDPVQVELAMELAGSALHVVRELRGKNLTPSASLTVDGALVVAPGAGSNDAVTQEMERRIGLGRDAFFTTIVARQKELARLVDLGPEARKQLLLSMLGIDAIDRAIQSARGEARRARDQVEALRRVVPDAAGLRAEAKTAARTLEHATRAVKEAATKQAAARVAAEAAEAEWSEAAKAKQAHVVAVKDVQAAEEALRASTRALDAAKRSWERSVEAAATIKNLAPVAQELPRLEARWAAHVEAQGVVQALEEARRALSSVPAIDDPRPALAQTQSEILALRRALDEARTEAAGRAAHETAVANRLRRLLGLGEQAPCPVCEQPVGDQVLQVRAGLQTEREAHQAATAQAQVQIEEMEGRLTGLIQTEQALQERLQAARMAGAEAKRLAEIVAHHEQAAEGARADGLPLGVPAALEASLRDARSAHERVLRLERDAARVEADAAEVASSTKAVAEAERLLVGARQSLKAAAWDAEAEARVEAAVVDARRARTEADRDHAEAETAVRLAEAAVADAERRLVDAKQQHEVLKELETDARYWTALAAGRGKGLLEAFRGHIVSRIGPAVSAEASRLLARFTEGRYTEVLLDDDYNLFVGDGGVHYTLDRFSGGESDLVHLALRLAVSRLIVERQGGTELRFLALDEVFGSLDHGRRDAVLTALGELGGLYSQVLLVTHQDHLRDALDHAILVEDCDGEAVVMAS